MTPIPKRPEYNPPFISPCFTVEEVKHLEDMATHEHAVAVALWKALNDTVKCNCEDCIDLVYKTIKRVTASGWKP